MDAKRYEEMLAKFKAGRITEQQWTDFCGEYLDMLLEANKDVLLRLKNR